MTLTDQSTASPPATTARSYYWPVTLGAAGLVVYVLAVWLLQPYQWNVVTYRPEQVANTPFYAPSFLFAWSLVLAPLALALWASLRRTGRVGYGSLFASMMPLLLSTPLVISLLVVDRIPVVSGGVHFILVTLLMLGTGWAAYRAWNIASSRTRGKGLVDSADRRGNGWAMVSVCVLIVLLVVFHTRDQINFFDHFMLGHADMGHFAEELKNALAGRGLRSDSFPNTRFGWHFTPLLYVLVPGYWFWPSPVYLMVCGALFIHIAAVPIYFLARRLSGSALVGWLFAVAWLLHPSISRLVYSGTYGFQWLYVTIPLTMWLISAGVLNRWRTFFVLLIILFLCRETVVATTLGLGLYWLLFTQHRLHGSLTALLSLFYGIVCVALIIPYFAASGEYERMAMFGPLGNRLSEVISSAITQPGLFWGRLVRSTGLWFILVIIAPMAFLPFKALRFSLAALPALALILLLDNEQWLSNKFWYQVSVLPIWFGAAMLCVTTEKVQKRTPPGDHAEHTVESELAVRIGERRHRAIAFGWAMLICAGWGHYLFGFSPIAKAYDLYYHNEQLQTPDPRLAVVEQLRDRLPRSSTILATERLAAHFTDYRRLYTGKRIKPADYVILDRADGWDSSGLPQRLSKFNESPEYRLFGVFESIVVFERDPAAPRDPDDD